MRRIFLSVLLVIAACAPVRVEVPREPQPPHFTLMLTNFLETPYDQIDNTNVSVSGPVFGSAGAVIRLEALTVNTYGISKATMKVTQGSTVLYDITNSQKLGWHGTVDEALWIGGSDGSGGVGQSPIRITLPSGVMKNDQDAMRVAIVATDFYGNTKELDVWFYSDNGCDPNYTSEPQGQCICKAPSKQCIPTGCCGVHEACCNGQCIPDLEASTCNVHCQPGEIPESDGTCCPAGLTSYCPSIQKCFLPNVPFPINPCGN